MKRYNKYILFICAAFIALCYSCSADDVSSDGDDTKVDNGKMYLNICCAPSNDTRAVTADGTDVGISKEWIKTWKVVIVDAASKVEAVIDRDAASEDLIEADKKEIKDRLTFGKKTVYAFANLSDEQLKNASFTSLKVDDKATIATLDALTLDPYNASYQAGTADNEAKAEPFTIGAGGNIPMSNRFTINVTDAESQTFNVPLYRMLAKLSFSFTSEAEKDVTVTGVRISPATTTGEYLFPINTNFGGDDRIDYTKAPAFSGAYKAADVTATWSNCKVPVGTKEESAVTPAPIYINESKAYNVANVTATQNVHNRMAITLLTKRDGADKEEEYSYTMTNLAYINRNDWIKIPIVLTDYVFYPQVFYYPPIGGYPEATVTTTDNKTYIVFGGGGGQFAIHPNLYKSNSADPLTFTDANITVVDNNPTIFTDDGKDKPKYDASTGEITGTLNGTAGTATITLSMTVTTGTEPGTSETLTRELYIVVN